MKASIFQLWLAMLKTLDSNKNYYMKLNSLSKMWCSGKLKSRVVSILFLRSNLTKIVEDLNK